jgi:adenosine kinase
VPWLLRIWWADEADSFGAADRGDLDRLWTAAADRGGMTRIAVSGSIATDHLMTFPGRFGEQLLPGSLATVSLSFLVDDLIVRWGGVAANIAFGLGQLGLRPVLVGAAGIDFADYRAWLEQNGVDCDSVHLSRTAHTARFVCTTDRDMCQIASFYPGAMGEAAHLRLADVAARTGGLDRVLIGADDPAVMLARARECRALGLPFIADPSQQLATLSGADIRAFIAGADYLITNEYEAALLESRTGLSPTDLLGLVGGRIVTLGERGVRLTGQDRPPIDVPAARTTAVVDPTGVGDGFRAGFLAGLAWEVPPRRAAELGCAVAAHVIEAAGPQAYTLDGRSLADRLAGAYGDAAADELMAPWTTANGRT